MELIVIGGFIEVFEALEENDIKIVGYIDKYKFKKYSNYEWLGTDNDVFNLNYKHSKSKILISPDQPSIRKSLYDFYKDKGLSLFKFIHKEAKISATTKINEGVFIQKMVHISSNCKISKMVKLNVAVNIMHDSVIGEFTTIAPNAVILGNVSIGNRCYIGANSTILPNVDIVDDVIIGAGSVVTKSINMKGTYVGVPAKKIK